MENNIQNLRKLLNVPPEIRIAQHIYNMFRDYEQKLEIAIREGKGIKFMEKSAQGIDIFYVDDDEFIKRFIN